MYSIWSLKISVGGTEYLFSVDAVAPLDSAGNPLPHYPGLQPPAMSEELDWGAGAGGAADNSVSFAIPGDLLTDLASDALPVMSIYAELTRLMPGDAWEARRKVAVGILQIQKISAEGDMVDGSIESIDPTAIIPADSEVVEDQTFGTDDYLPSNEDAIYPLVFGAPGSYVTNVGDVNTTKAKALKVLGVDLSVGLATRGVLSAGWCETSTVKLYSIPEAAWVTVATIDDTDDLGQAITTVNLNPGLGIAPTTWTRDDSMEIYVTSWNDGGITDPAVGNLLTGAASVSRYLLQRGGAEIDEGSFYEAAAYCDRVHLAGYLDEQVDPSNYVAENIQPLLPRLYIVPGADGLRAVTLQDAYLNAPHLIMGQTCQTGVDNDLVYATSGGITSMRLNFAPWITTGVYHARVTVDADGQPDPDVYTTFASPFAAAGRARVPTPVEVAEDTDIVYDRETAVIVCEERLMWGWTKAQFMTATLFADDDDPRYRLGAYITLTDASHALVEQGAWVVGRAEDGDMLGLRLAILR